MKFELKHINKWALSVLLFVCVYHVFSLLIHGSYLICLFFLCAGIINGRTLIKEQNNTKNSPYSHYFYALSAAWLAVFLMLFTANEQASTVVIWFSILILCTSILLKPSHALRLNTAALAICWAFSFLVSNETFTFIDSALALTVIFFMASIIKKYMHELEAKLNRAIETDKLTGCIQPNAFIHELTKVEQLHKRYETPFSLICIKYQSHFSTENDLQIWLKELTYLYQSRLRKTDILCRFTAQKFMILLPSTSEQNAETLLLDLKNCTKVYEFSFKQQVSEGIESPSLSFSTETFIKNSNIEDWFKKIQSQ